MVGIYKITSPSNKVYIGQSWNIDKRIRSYLSTTLRSQRKLYYSFLKYGSFNHKYKVVHELPKDVTQDILDLYEQFYMDSYRGCGIELLNIREGGSKGKNHPESIERMRIANTGKKASEQTKQKMILSRTGLKRSEDTKQKMSAWQVGKKKGARSNETKRKISAANMGVKNNSAKLNESQVIEIRQKRDDGNTLKQIANEYNVSIANVYDIAKRKIWTHI